MQLQLFYSFVLKQKKQKFKTAEKMPKKKCNRLKKKQLELCCSAGQREDLPTILFNEQLNIAFSS